MNAQQAIKQSIHQNEIVTLTLEGPALAEAEETLRVECSDWTESNGGLLEFWGEQGDEAHEWRVHLRPVTA
jgi:hypothetical protein